MSKNDDIDIKIILYILLFLLFGIIIITCKTEPSDTVMTVTGPVPAEKIGITLEHEHILVDFIGADSTGPWRWDKNKVIEKTLPFLTEIRQKGVTTFIECTPEYLGRDPLVLKELSVRSGINIITNTGYYGARKNLYLPSFFYSKEPEELAEIWADEFRKGINDTGIKPGFIKISVDADSVLSSDHRKIITAAGLTHLKTGLVIASHTGPDGPAFEQMKILDSLGIDLSAFIWVHAQGGTLESNIEAAKRGAWISLDGVMMSRDKGPDASGNIDWYAERIIKLKNEGLLGKVLVSHDAGWYDPSKEDGGTFRGFTDVFDYLIPALKEKGLTQNEIDQILVNNPAEAFKIKIRKINK